jgi:hypothetical protein
MPKYGLATLEIDGRAVFTFSANSKLNVYERMLHRYKSWDPSPFVPGDMIFWSILPYLKLTYWDGKAPIKVRKATDLEENRWTKSITKVINKDRGDAREHHGVVMLD